MCIRNLNPELPHSGEGTEGVGWGSAPWKLAPFFFLSSFLGRRGKEERKKTIKRRRIELVRVFFVCICVCIYVWCVKEGEGERKI